MLTADGAPDGEGGGAGPQLPAIRKLLYQAYHKLFELRRVVCGLEPHVSLRGAEKALILR